MYSIIMDVTTFCKIANLGEILFIFNFQFHNSMTK